MVSGAGGFVGGRVAQRAAPDRELHALWRTHPPPPGGRHHQVELADAGSVRSVVERAHPEVVLHAAYAMAASRDENLLWSRNLLAAAVAVGARFVLISTDLVFDGRRGWYREDEPPNPTLPYGAWKAELERDVAAAGGVVARTSLVWG